MADLIPQTPCAARLPLEIGAMRLEETDPGPLTTLAPYKDKQKTLSDALSAAYGLGYPAPNQTGAAENAQIFWFGRDIALLAGVEPDPALGAHAALTDQSDAWAAVELSGPHVDQVLARFVPIDLRAGAFAQGRTARTLLGHMNVSITRTGADRFLILVFRSMAVTLVDELREVMETVSLLPVEPR